MKNKISKTSLRKHIIIGVVTTVIFLIGAGNLVFTVDAYYDERIAPGVVLGSVDIGNTQKEDVRALLEAYHANLDRDGIELSYQGQIKKITARSVPMSPDVSPDQLPGVAKIDIDKTIDAVYAIGHTGNPLSDYPTRIRGLIQKTRLTATPIISSEALTAAAQKEFPALNQRVREPQFTMDADGVIGVDAPTPGANLDTPVAVADLESQIRELQIPVVTLSSIPTHPRLTTEELTDSIGRVNQLVGTSTLILIADTTKTELTPRERIAWVRAEKGDSENLMLKIDRAVVREYLEKIVAPKIFVKSEIPRYEIKDGKIAAFQEPVSGRELDIDRSLSLLVDALEGAAAHSSVTLPITESPIMPSDVPSDIFIKEVVAKGETDFRGSPPNRRKNIAVGLSKINGIVIPQGAEFSLLSLLKPIDKEGGFLPELVIKGSKTTPEYGGGLCQVSTTLFRAVSYAGLPVKSRRNHSYRVSYYEPPVGFDATIYDPAPDFTFTNDTGGPILIQASVKGTKARVALWGTKDGRMVEVDPPRVFNIKKATETKIIETDALKPGEKKCTERAHDGADAVFERRVTYSSGEKKTDVYKSHYVVWPAVCLVGKNPVPPPSSVTSTDPLPSEHTNDSSATSTENFPE